MNIRAFFGRIGPAFWFLFGGKGWPVSIEARYGAFRTRSNQIFHGQLLRVDIPLQKQHGKVAFGGKELDTRDIKRMIDGATGVEGEDPLHHRQCNLCGQRIK